MQATRGAPITSDPADELAPPNSGGASSAIPANRTHRVLIAGLALLGYGLDQLTKWLAIEHLDPANPPSFLGGLVKLRLIFNPGAAFSLGSNATIVFTIISIVAFIAVSGFVAPRVRGRLHSVIVGFLLAGIAGNLTDRLFRAPGPFVGHVVDFISLPRFAIFNVADMFITSAAVLLVIASIFHRDEPAAEPSADEQQGATDQTEEVPR